MSSIAVDAPGVMGQVREAVEQAQPQAKTMQVVGLPGYVRWFFQVFAIVIYGPDMYFGYQIYTKGGALISSDTLIAIAEIALFATLAAGTVGMAYLLSVLAPYHWRKGHKGTALLCGLGVVIATGVTILFSLAYRSEHPVSYAFDATVQGWIPVLRTWNISPIQTIAAFAPPFWGLFWALVQPTDARSDEDIEADDENAVEKIRQRAAIKAAQIEAKAQLKQTQAAANAQARAAQIGGLVQTAREAGRVIAAKASGAEPSAPDQQETGTPSHPLPETGTDSAPKPGTKAFTEAVRKHIGAIEAHGVKASIAEVARRMNESEANVAPVFNNFMDQRRKRR